MAIWVAIILGIIQGIFMFFPVSSTSHLALMQHFLISRGVDLPDPDSAEMILFDLIVHVGTLISIAYVFRRSLSTYLSSTISGFLELLSNERTARGALYRKLTFLGLFSVFITGVIGFPMKSVFESVFAQPLFMSGTLIITGIILWWTDYLPPRKYGLREIGLWIAFVIGAAQALALLPGLSRSGMTIAFALFVGLNRRWAAEYSFFIAFPTILGATLLQTIEVFSYGGTISIGFPALATGFIVSAIIGVMALKLVIHLLYRAQFRVFSYYVWALALVVAISSLSGIL
ncbi:MAG: undecaprenyl-diphosphate phosphatase [Balneolaceae bacterium]|nr:undecaprenyl-diphosphate phosphatase [Balneolaceae bacterium]